MKIADNDKKKIRSMYEARFSQFGYSPQALGWTKGKQDMRFDVLLSFYNCENRSILDVGCGFGDLNKTLLKRFTNYYYLGIDFIEGFIKEGKSRFENDKINFKLGDFLKMEIGKKYDYGIACGFFNYKFKEIDNYEYIDAVLAKLFVFCNDGIAVDFLSDKVNFKRDYCFYNNLETVIGIVRKYTRNFIVRSDYMPFEFAVIMFKDDSYEDYDTIFSKYKERIA